MSKTFRETANDEPVFVEVLSETSTPDKGGVLFVSNTGRFVFKWAGQSPSEQLTAEYTGGYIRFPNFHSGFFLDNMQGQRTVRPHHLVRSVHRSVVDAEKYDRVQVTFKNIFTGLKQDIHEHKVVDLHEATGVPELAYKDTELKVYIGGEAKYSGMPRMATYRQDRLTFQFTGTASLGIDDISRIVARLRQTITLFTKKPCNPAGIEVGMRQDDGMYHYGTCEYSAPGQYAADAIDITDALEVDESGKTFLYACLAALERDEPMSTEQWFAYCESRAGGYYLDAVASNLLSCAESVFYLLPDSKSSAARGERYEQMLAVLRGHADPKVDRKLIKWLKGKKRDYEDPKAYADKIECLMTYVGAGAADSRWFQLYLNQLRNQLMHGLPRNWDTLVIKEDDKVTEWPVDVGAVIRQLEAIVQKCLIQWLTTEPGVMHTDLTTIDAPV